MGLWALRDWVKNFWRRLAVWGQLERSTSPEDSLEGDKSQKLKSLRLSYKKGRNTDLIKAKQ